jgi:hypothetical protein
VSAGDAPRDVPDPRDTTPAAPGSDRSRAAQDGTVAGDRSDGHPAVPRRVLPALLPAGLFLACRLVQLLLVGLLTPDAHAAMPLRNRLMLWDAGWFARVATEGYPHGYSYDPAGHMVGNGLAFFPGYPAMIAAVRLVGVPADVAALTVAWLSGAVAAVLVARLGEALYDRRTGLALALIFSAQPLSVALGMGYSEGLFTALATGALLAAYRLRWPLAGALGLAAALTRPTGAAVAVALAVAALLAVRRGRATWAAPAWTGLALAGVPAYLAWVALRVGDPLAWFRIQTAGWGTRFDGGAAALRFLLGTLAHGTEWVAVSVALMLVAAVVAVVLAVRDRVWPPLLVYGSLALVLVLGQAGYYHSKPRLLVPVLLVFVPAAVAAGRAGRRAALLGLSCWSAFGLWYGAYLVTVWPYTI